MDLGRVGRGAVAAIDLRGRCLIAGLLRTAVRGRRRPLYLLTWCSGSGADHNFLFRELRWAPAAMKLADGPRAGGARGRGGDRPTGSMLDRRAVAHSGEGSQASSLSVDVVQRQRRRP